MGDQSVFLNSKNDYANLTSFKNTTLETSNYLSFYPERKYVNEIEKGKEKKEESTFYGKYNAVNLSGEGVFNLEEEMVKLVKNWIWKNDDYNFTNKRDEFYNEEYVKEVLFEKKFFNSTYSIVNFELIFFIIEHLEKKSFDYVLLQQWTYKDEKNLPPLKAPLFKVGFIELLIKNDLEEKLNCLYQDKSLGYTYIAENLITFDLFIIYIILKNYPFYVLTRSRLENLFDSLKKYKSWPYPIGSIGMDIFKLLINELYLPGVTIFEQIREKYLLDIIDPKIKEIQIKDFNKVISFNKTIYGSLDANLEDKNEKLKKSLSSQTNLTFSFLGVYIAYILYANEEKKENDREENYLENILSLFEKKFKNYKMNNQAQSNNMNNSVSMEDKETIDISEKNIINNLFNVIDNGLNTKFEKFSKEIKILNDKFILKAKETHDAKGSKPRDLINVRKFLEPKIKFIDFAKNPEYIYEDSVNKTFYFNDNDTLKKKIELQNQNSVTNQNPNDEAEEKDDLLDKENIIKIKMYKEQLAVEKEVKADEILTDYVANFLEIKKKYFGHLKQFKIEDYKFSVEREKQEVIEFNKTVKIREKQLAEKFNQKYIMTEEHLSHFIKNIKYWRSNITSIYHTSIAMENQNSSKKTENKKETTFSMYNERERQKEQNQNERKELENILCQKLNFNYQIYLLPSFKTLNNNSNNNSNIPEQPIKSLVKYISKKDFLYKTIVGNFYLSYEENNDPETKAISEIPLKLYLTEANQFFNLKVFNLKVDANGKTENKPFYGSLHIETTSNIHLELIDLNQKYNFVSDLSEEIYIDIINLYDYDDETEKRRINDMERYLVTSTDNYFQIFVSSNKGDTHQKVLNGKNDDYFKRFVVNLLDFDSQTMNFQAKKIKITVDNLFTTFLKFTNQVLDNCNSIELDFDSYEPVKIATFLDIN